MTCPCGKEGGCTKRKCPAEAALRAKMLAEHGGDAPAVGGLAKPLGTFGAGEEVRVTVRVENVGQLPGDEVVQVYVRDVAASVPMPIRSLVAFRRVHLAAGEAREVTLAVSPRQLSVISDDGRRVVEPGVFQLWVGGKQPGFSGVADAGTTDVVSAQFQIAGDVTPIER
jgi:beta-glucosidase